MEGLGEEHPAAQVLMNLPDAEVTAIRNATQAAWQRMFVQMRAAGKYNWQAFGYEDGLGMTPGNGSCVRDMRVLCATPQDAPLTMEISTDWVNQTLAAFLIVRTQHAWVGWG